MLMRARCLLCRVEDSVRFAKDTIHLVRYQTVRRLIINDMVELL